VRELGFWLSTPRTELIEGTVVAIGTLDDNVTDLNGDSRQVLFAP